jgi:hypothetical protein
MRESMAKLKIEENRDDCEKTDTHTTRFSKNRKE